MTVDDVWIVRRRHATTAGKALLSRSRKRADALPKRNIVLHLASTLMKIA
ncbi:hypothetical protein CPter91_3463 [Collimonas pratensis]|uniref:Transposase n=1 Tax=Collimonas pratensis TaxID=279113 RepID=A0A127Q6V5_9BURK|nr:hypothetical protein CPter91_3463 [Collimonas pratensis]